MGLENCSDLTIGGSIAKGLSLNECFPGWKLIEQNGLDYVEFKEFDRIHRVKVKENTWGRYIKYMGDSYYLR